MMQLLELVEQFAVPHGLQDGDVAERATKHRCRNFWRLLWPSIFDLKRELIKRQMEMSMFKTALDLAETIEAWMLVFRPNSVS